MSGGSLLPEMTALIVPKQAAPLPAGSLSRAARLQAIADADSTLDRKLRERLAGIEISYLAGTRSWIVRAWPNDLPGLAKRLDGLPVDVLPDATFSAI